MNIRTIVFILVMAPVLIAQIPQVEWWRTYGDENRDGSTGIYKTADSAYLICGKSQTFHGCNNDFFIIKISGSGDTVLTRTIGGVGTAETPTCFNKMTDGRFVAGGSKATWRDSQFYLLVLNGDGDSVWSNTYGDTTHPDEVYDVQELSNGRLLFTGTSYRLPGGYQIAIANVFGIGDTVGSIPNWLTYYGLQETDQGRGVIVLNDSSYIICGNTSAFVTPGNEDICFTKVDGDGDTIWLRNYGGAQEESINKAIKTSDGGVIAVGYSITAGGGYYKDWYIVRANANGDTLWTRSFGNSYEDVAMDVKELPDNRGFVVVGAIHYGQWDACVIRLSSEGDSLWGIHFGGAGYDIANSIELSDDGGYIIAGETDSYGAGNYDIYVVKLSPDLVGIEENSQAAIPEKFAPLQNYPNPFNSATMIEFDIAERSRVSIDIYNLLGQKVNRLVEAEYPVGKHKIFWNGTDSDGTIVPSGIYYCRLAAQKDLAIRKMLLLK